jgi:IPT/TIG domain/Galactose oxidase, central domain
MIRITGTLVLLVVFVATSGCGSGSSAQVHSAATISSISPTSAVPGSADITLTLTGSHFPDAPLNHSRAAWSINGSVSLLPTVFVSSTQLTAVVPASFLINPVTAQVLVETGDFKGDSPLRRSNSVNFSVATPPPGKPSISSISPTTAAPGSPDVTLTITGSNFDGAGVIRSRVLWSANGTMTPLATTFASSNQLTAVIPAALLSNPVTALVLVQNWDNIEGGVHATSNSVSFSVSKPSLGSLSISSISPASAVAGSMDLTVTIAGSNLDLRHAGSHSTFTSVVWSANGTDTMLPATVISSAQLTAVVPAALLAKAVTARLSVLKVYYMDDAPFAVSNTLNFIVSASAAPGISAVSPTLATLGPKGTQQFAATLNGNKAEATWEIEEGAVGGSITSSGFYTVPARGGTFHVIATFVADPSKNAAATVSVFESGFTLTGSMGKPRSGHTATLLGDGRVLIVGGADATAELFDPLTATFSPTGGMTTQRYGATATLLANGKVLITGGFGPGTSSLPRLNSAELYDPMTGTFSATGSMADARILHTATLLNDGKVLIAGGTREGGGGGAAIASAELYDPSTGTFAPTRSMNTDRAQHTATLLTNGEVLIAGGWNGHRADSADDPPWDPLFAELFDPSSGKFKYAGSMSTTRIGHTATRFTNGRVLLLGGIFSLQNIHSQPPAPRYAEIYDPATDNFSGLDDLTMSRQGYTVTLLRNGEVLLAGGKILDLVVPTAELLNLTTGALSVTGGLGTERVGHTATLLTDGRVLITGGTDAKGNDLASAELYK